MNKQCHLCGCKVIETLDATVRDNKDLSVLKCRDCGLVFLSSFDHIKDGFYENSNMYDNGESIADTILASNDDDQRRFDYLKDRIKGKTILDFGCGNGNFLNKVNNLRSQREKKYYSGIIGIEPEQRMTDYIRCENIEVYEDMLSLNAFSYTESFDFIVMFHTIEHLVEPIKVLKELKDLMNKNSTLIIETPNSNDILFNIKEFRNFSYWSKHVFLYNEKSLRLLIEKAGLKVKDVKYIQRYNFLNHFNWLWDGKPGGHKKYSYLFNKTINDLYTKYLQRTRKTDTIWFEVGK